MLAQEHKQGRELAPEQQQPLAAAVLTVLGVVALGAVGQELAVIHKVARRQPHSLARV